MLGSNKIGFEAPKDFGAWLRKRFPRKSKIYLELNNLTVQFEITERGRHSWVLICIYVGADLADLSLHPELVASWDTKTGLLGRPIKPLFWNEAALARFLHLRELNEQMPPNQRQELKVLADKAFQDVCTWFAKYNVPACGGRRLQNWASSSEGLALARFLGASTRSRKELKKIRQQVQQQALADGLAELCGSFNTLTSPVQGALADAIGDASRRFAELDSGSTICRPN